MDLIALPVLSMFSLMSYVLLCLISQAMAALGEGTPMTMFPLPGMFVF
jgi:hypothetical protein